jgi:hypothetical protein
MSKNFAKFDDTNFPVVIIKFNGTIQNDIDFDIFIDTWKSYDKFKKKYTFVFDSSEVTSVPIKYTYKMSSFIRELKQDRENVYLERSIIVCNNYYIRKLLEFIFFLEKPLAPVYIVDNMNKVHDLYTTVQLDPNLYDFSVTLIAS